ncbi:hypothetical protein BaRGS_00020201 [Batillaria attramentaria]|uniref:Protein kinase A anchor protein nuclear localisation signal domain-containing protein n=1 Tax=Batillaria attramentaria TaxID=370345 RepID=A0ABD0KNA4_9CAEN
MVQKVTLGFQPFSDACQNLNDRLGSCQLEGYGEVSGETFLCRPLLLHVTLGSRRHAQAVLQRNFSVHARHENDELNQINLIKSLSSAADGVMFRKGCSYID